MAVVGENTTIITAPASSSAEYRLKAYFKETGINESKNKHYITVKGSIKSLRSGTSFSTTSNHTLKIYWQDDGDYKTRMLVSETSVPSLDGNEEVEIEEDISVEGNDDGDLSGRAICVWTKSGSNIYVPSSGDVATDYEDLEHIDTYAEITKFKVYKVDETSVEIDWDTDEVVDRVRYNIDGGTYHTLPSNGIITGLNAGQSYVFRIEVRRKSNGLITDSGRVTQSTYSYPYGQTLPNFNIGQQLNIGLYNPLNRTVTVSIITDDNQEHGSITTNTNGISGFDSAEWQNIWVNSIPNSKSGTYKVKVVYGAINTNISSASGTYTIDNSDNSFSPTFDSSYWSYTANLTNLTNDNQVVIDGKSTITFSIDTQAVAKYNSSIDFYRYKWGDVFDTTNIISLGNGNILEVTAVDTRGFSTTTYLELTDNYVTYIPISITTQNTHREGGAGSNTFLNIVGNMYCGDFGASGITNEIISANYYVLQSGDTWSSPYSIDITQFEYNASYNRFTLDDYAIHENGTSGGFPVGQSYVIKFELEDNLGNYMSTNVNIADGKMARDVYKDYNGDYHEGINGLANSNYTQEVHGTINATNGIFTNGVELKPSTMSIGWENSNPSSSFSAQTITLNTDDYDMYEILYDSGVSAIGVVSSGIVPKGNVASGTAVSINGSRNIEVYSRKTTGVTDTTISFALARGGNNGNYTDNNSYMIPIYVILYKTNLQF